MTNPIYTCIIYSLKFAREFSLLKYIPLNEVPFLDHANSAWLQY